MAIGHSMYVCVCTCQACVKSKRNVEADVRFLFRCVLPPCIYHLCGVSSTQCKDLGGGGGGSVRETQGVLRAACL